MLSKVLILVLAVVALLWGCGGTSSGGSSDGGGGVTVVVSPATFVLAPGDQKTFVAIVNGTDNGQVRWSTTGGQINSDGVYTAPTTLGTYTVTATSKADESVKGTAKVTVTSGVGVNISPASTTVAPNATKQFTANVIGTTDKTVTWTATLGTIDASGLYTAPSTEGTDTITATSNADPSAKASATVTISKGGSGVTVTVTPALTTCGTNESVQFTATVSGSSDTSVIWAASSGTVDSSGLYTAPSTPGTYTVTASSNADPTKKGTATVTVDAVGITISPTTTSTAPGGTAQFTATVTGAKDKSVTWTCSNGTITAVGLWTAPVATGEYTVTATSNADPTKKATASVTVVSQTSYSFNFEDGIPSSYFDNTDRAITAPNGQKYYGNFGSSDVATMTIPGLPAHQSVRVQFDVYVVDDWRGTNRSDEWGWKANDVVRLDTTFSNGYNSYLQNYPDAKGGATHPAGYQSTANNTLGYSVGSGLAYSDTTYHVDYTIVNTDPTLIVKWYSVLSNGVPFWGIDNVKVDLLNSSSVRRSRVR